MLVDGYRELMENCLMKEKQTGKSLERLLFSEIRYPPLKLLTFSMKNTLRVYTLHTAHSETYKINAHLFQIVYIISTRFSNNFNEKYIYTIYDTLFMNHITTLQCFEDTNLLLR